MEILDIGCGLRKDGTVNVDLNRNVEPTIVCDIHFLPFGKEAFDKVILKAVVEHTLNPDLLVEGCYEVLKHNGLIIASFPNFASFTVLVDWFKKKPTYSESLILGDTSNKYLTYRRLHTVTTVKKLLTVHGFYIENIIGHAPGIGSNLLCSVGSFLVRLLPHRAGNITMIGRKISVSDAIMEDDE